MSDRLNASFTVAVYIEREGKLLMIQKKSTGLWGVPSGHILAGETVMEAAIREALEEMGIQISPYGILGIYHFPRKDGPSICVAVWAFANPNAEFVAKDVEEVDKIEWKDGSFVDYLISGGPVYRPEYTVHNLISYRDRKRYPLELLQEIRVPWIE